MSHITSFQDKNLKYDLINRYTYNNCKKLPKFKKTILNFNCKNDSIKELASSLLALKLLTMQKGVLTKAKIPNISLKIKKGSPVGCKITLRKKAMFNFFFRITCEILKKLKNRDRFTSSKLVIPSTFLCQFKDCLLFWEFEKHYYLFKSVTNLNVIFVTSNKYKKTSQFFFNSLQFPTNIRKYNSMVEYNLAKIKVEGSIPFICFFIGHVAEWFKALVLKTIVLKKYHRFESYHILCPVPDTLFKS